LLSSGYIAGGTLCGLILGFFAMLPKSFNDALNIGMTQFGEDYSDGKDPGAKLASVAAFVILAGILYIVGRSKPTELSGEPSG